MTSRRPNGSLCSQRPRRQRQRWHRAEKTLILQGKALCRALCKGDKAEGTALFDKAQEGGDVDIATMAALAPFLASIKHFEGPRKDLEKQINKLTNKLCKTITCHCHN